MKKIYKKISILLIVLVLVLSFLFQTQAETIYNYEGYSYYLLTNTTASLCGWDDRNPELQVPKDILEKYIVEISDSAFKNDENITSLNLSKASMLQRIGSYAFDKCTNLSGGFTIPQKVNSLGLSAFQECSSLESVKMKSSYINVISAQAFYKCASLTEVVLPDDLQSINKLAFADCTSLSEIIISKSVTSIDSTAFNNDENLVIKCYKDSYAEQYAKDNGISYEILDPLYGDANEDGEVDIMDVTFIQKYKIGTKTFVSAYGKQCADVNKSGDVTIRDATMIQMKIAKIIENF